MGMVAAEPFDLEEFQREVLQHLHSFQGMYSDSGLATMSLRESRSPIYYEVESGRILGKAYQQKQKLYQELETLLQNRPLLWEWDFQQIRTQLQDIDRDVHTRVEDLLSQRDSVQYDLLQELLEREEQRRGTGNMIVEATKVLLQRDVRRYLCPALQSLSNDSYDVAKIITPILVPLALAGTLSIPLQPLLFAHLALLIVRMGVASVCEEYKKKPEKEE